MAVSYAEVSLCYILANCTKTHASALNVFLHHTSVGPCVPTPEFITYYIVPY